MARPRAADDFAMIRARMEELRRERQGTQAVESDLRRDARTERWHAKEVSSGQGRVREPGSAKRLDRDAPWWARSE